MLTLQERDSALQAFLTKHFPKSDPSVVRSDFDGDGNPDYALLLKNDKRGKTILVVALCTGDSQGKSVYHVDVSDNSSFVYIRPVLVGSRVSQTEAISTRGSSPVRLKFEGIRLTNYEQAEVVLSGKASSRRSRRFKLPMSAAALRQPVSGREHFAVGVQHPVKRDGG